MHSYLEGNQVGGYIKSCDLVGDLDFINLKLAGYNQKKFLIIIKK